MSPEQHGPAPIQKAVFVDHSGRRRRLVIVSSIASGVLALAMFAIVIGGLFSSTTLSVSGWPGNDGESPASAASPGASEPAATPRASMSRRPTPTATPTRTRAIPTVRSRVTRRATPSQQPVPDTVVDPREPSPSAEPSATPSGDPRPSTEPTPDPTPDQPPGLDKTPPGHAQGKTKGPKE
ncbi:hypothetical protein [Nonomuraea roseola]|uniref:Uncharacterized protein n=1 Tax=Nonomuraea roseola TaxID=46179 RepID=A0ABV5PXZ2_9ACTN